MVDLNLSGLGITVGVGVARSFFGWAENALLEASHGGTKITSFEVRELIATVVRVGSVTTALFFGVKELFGADVTILGASAGAFIADWIVLKLRSKRK